MKNLLPISCKCTTYGRVEFLEEMLYSYLQQEYEGDSEFLIVNDYPLQELVFDHPKVRIINLDKTFEHIGEKENFAVQQCRYNTIAVTDDDDVMLKNHLENINQFFPGNQLLHWRRGVFMMKDKVKQVKGIGNAGIVFDRSYLNSILGGYPIGDEGVDMKLVLGLKRNKAKVAKAAPNLPSFFYRWGNGSYHLSGQGAAKEGRDNIIVRHSRHIENLRKQGKIPEGIIHLNPNWKHDYEQMLKNFIKNRDNATN